MKYALIGCGRIAVNHMKAAINNKLEIVAVCDVLPEKMEALLAKYDPKLSVVFCNTKKMVDELSEYLTNAGYQAVGIHGDMRQSARTQVMASFKSHRTRILIVCHIAEIARHDPVTHIVCQIKHL